MQCNRYTSATLIYKVIESKLELQAVMQGSKKCAFRRHNATRNVRFAGTKRSMCSKRYPEPVDTKDLTVVGVARSQCSVFAAKFCRRYTISSFMAPPNGEIFRNFYRTALRLAPTCVYNLDSFRCLILDFFGFLIFHV